MFNLIGMVRVPVTTNMMRTFDKLGGLDTYLKTAKPAELSRVGNGLLKKILLKEAKTRLLDDESKNISLKVNKPIVSVDKIAELPESPSVAAPVMKKKGQDR